MINKRLLIKNLLAHNDENSFYDKKRHLNIGHREGKAKFLKHICALANSNPANNSYIVIGVEDEDNSIIGVDFFDDSKIQNLINAYLENAPKVSYENILFPHLAEDKVVGLVTVRSSGKVCSLRRNIWKYYGGAVFLREGSMSMPRNFGVEIMDANSETVLNIEQHARNNIELTLDGVIDFINHRHNELESFYKVFKEQFVVCWAGNAKKIKDKTYFSRVDIELINEQVRLFYSALDEVEITFDNNSFTTTEYVALGLGSKNKYYPLEQLTLNFNENGTYTQNSVLLFEPPLYNKQTLHHMYNSSNVLLDKVAKGIPLSVREEKELLFLADTYLICYLNKFEEAKERLEMSRAILKEPYPEAYELSKKSLRILRKVRYN